MRIGGLPRRTGTWSTLPEALEGRAAALGHRPAVTVLSVRGHEEQGFASLAQWAVKGAHLLELELQVEPGDRLLLRGPPGWMPAAIAAAAWRAGMCVVTEGVAAVAVVHEDHPAPEGAVEVLGYGDAVDGSPVGHGARGPWALAVQAFPDQPGPSRARPDTHAILLDGRVLTHTEALSTAAGLGTDGPLGLEATATDPALAVLAVAGRPAATGSATVVVREGATRAAAEAEHIASWLAG